MANIIIYKRENMINQIEFKKGVQEVLSSKKKTIKTKREKLLLDQG
jgi:hypothetical protein